MKLDLNKPWVRKLASRNSVANGCAFIRGVILRTVWSAVLWTAAVTAGSYLVMALVCGGYMWFQNPAFFAGDFDRVAHFGGGPMAVFWAITVFLGGIVEAAVLIIGSIVGVIFLMVKGIDKSSLPVKSAVNAAWKAITPPAAFQDAVGAWYHKFCPKIEFILPAGLEGFVTGARIAQKKHEYDIDGNWTGTDIWEEGVIRNTIVKGHRLELEVLWDKTKANIEEHFAREDIIEDYDDEDERLKALLFMLTRRSDDVYIWYSEGTTNYKVVEETSSPA